MVPLGVKHGLYFRGLVQLFVEHSLQKGTGRFPSRMFPYEGFPHEGSSPKVPFGNIP